MAMQNRRALMDMLDPSADDAQGLAVQPLTVEGPGPDPWDPSGTGGVAGGLGGIAPGEGAPNSGPAPVLDQPIGGPAAPTRDFSRLTGYDQGKFDANKNDAKYQMGGVLSGFDPRQGLTPEVLAGLNGLGYGTFSGQGDKLSLSGLTDKGRQAKLQGDYKDADFIARFSDPGAGETPQWGYADPVEEARQAAAGGGAPGGGGLPGLPGQLGGDPMAMIQQALSKYGNSPNLQALLAQLGAA